MAKQRSCLWSSFADTLSGSSLTPCQFPRGIPFSFQFHVLFSAHVTGFYYVHPESFHKAVIHSFLNAFPCYLVWIFFSRYSGEKADSLIIMLWSGSPGHDHSRSPRPSTQTSRPPLHHTLWPWR
jgi:hypothetical protein